MDFSANRLSFLRNYLRKQFCCGITCGIGCGITCRTLEDTFTGRGISPIPEDISVGKFPSVSKILTKQLPAKLLPGSEYPWQTPQETCLLRIYLHFPQENREFHGMHPMFAYFPSILTYKKNINLCLRFL